MNKIAAYFGLIASTFATSSLLSFAASASEITYECSNGGDKSADTYFCGDIEDKGEGLIVIHSPVFVDNPDLYILGNGGKRVGHVLANRKKNILNGANLLCNSFNAEPTGAYTRTKSSECSWGLYDRMFVMGCGSEFTSNVFESVECQK
jgi:hypothetical protein